MELSPIVVSHPTSLPVHNPKMVFWWKWVSDSRGRPMVHFDRENLRVGTHILPLQGKQLVQQLVRTFLSAPLQRVHRQELVSQLYTARPLSGLSWRQRGCYQHNIVKLLSRTRKLLRDAFPFGTQWEWLPYDADSQTWSLYRLHFCPATEAVHGEPSAEVAENQSALSFYLGG